MTKSASRTFPAVVSAIERLSPNFVRVTFTSEDLADLGCGGPDQRIKVIFPLHGSRVSELPTGADWYTKWRLLPDDVRNPMRTYTIRRADPARRELVVDFVAHGDSGPASRWISRAEVGEQLLVVAPDATSGAAPGGYEWNPGQATTILIGGDETAVPAACAIIESLPAAARGAIFLEVPTAADIVPMQPPAGVELSWLPRDARPNTSHGALIDAAVRAWAGAWVGEEDAQPAADNGFFNPDSEVLWEVPTEPEDEGLYAWLAGEATSITGLRRHLVRDLGIDRSRIAFMGYWKLGKAEN